MFWIWDDNEYSWHQRKLQERRTRKGKRKGKKEKDKEDKDEDSCDLETKEKERVILQKKRATGLKMNGKEMNQRIGTKGAGPMKMRQHGNPKAGMNGRKIAAMSSDISKEKERKERKVMDLKIKEKDEVMGKEKQTM